MPVANNRQIWIHRTRRLGRQIIDLVFPPACLLCQAELQDSHRNRPGGDYFCHGCREDLVDHASSRCPNCARQTPSWVTRVDQCPSCRRNRLGLEGAICLGDYELARRAAVLQLKRAQNEPFGVGLGQLIAHRVALAAWFEQVDLVIPMPTHRWRRFQRWYNPAELLARPVAASGNCPYDDRLLSFCRPTAKQGTLSPAQRRSNLSGAFRIRDAKKLFGRQVLLVDDVMTSGATAAAAATACRRAGAASVHIAVVARGRG